MRVAAGNAEVGVYTCGRDTQISTQYIIDVSGLRDPGSNRGFNVKYKNGLPGEVQDFVKEDSRVAAIVDTIHLITHLNLRSEAADGGWLAFMIRDHHGKWIAPAVGEIVADSLSNLGYKVSVIHWGLSGLSGEPGRLP